MPETKLPDADVSATDAVMEVDSEVVEARKVFDGDDSEKAGRKHGRSFIYLSLEDAENAARKIDEHERRMSKTSFAQALGHPKPFGRFKQKLAALEAYGLVEQSANDVKLTDLAVEMLYGPTEVARTRARARAFLTYDLFKETFVQCPKNQDHQMSYVDDFVRVTLKIVNERDTFLKRFLESAKYAGLLEGEPDPKVKAIRLRSGVPAAANGESATEAKTAGADDQWEIVAPDDVVSLLEGMGLSAFQDRCDVSQRAIGEVTMNMADGKITVEVRRPVRVAIKSKNGFVDVAEVVKSLQLKGFKA